MRCGADERSGSVLCMPRRCRAWPVAARAERTWGLVPLDAAGDGRAPRLGAGTLQTVDVGQHPLAQIRVLFDEPGHERGEGHPVAAARNAITLRTTDGS